MQHDYKIACISDMHVGSTVALPAAKQYVLPDGQVLVASVAQLWLLECWQKYWREFHSIKAKRSAIIINGETVEGEHHAAKQIAGQAEVMEAMAVELLRSHIGKVNKLYVTRGSSAHSKQQGMADETVARELGAVRNSAGWHSDYNWRIDAGGVLIDVAHHISGGGVPWMAGNNVRRAVMSCILQAVQRFERPPDLLLRGHVHTTAQFEYANTKCIISPSWKLRDEYAHKISAGIAPIGGLYILIDKGQAAVTVRTFAPNAERPNKL